LQPKSLTLDLIIFLTEIKNKKIKTKVKKKNPKKNEVCGHDDATCLDIKRETT
jgi:hypothetical protein